MKIYEAEVLNAIEDGDTDRDVRLPRVVMLEDYREVKRRLDEKDKMYATSVALLAENARLATELAAVVAEVKALRAIVKEVV